MSDRPDPQYFRARLLALREQLEATAATGEDAARTVKLDQSRVGRLSRMDALQAQAMSQASNQRREKLLSDIAAALRRIDGGTYGECAECAEFIAVARLEVDPVARLCIDCAAGRQ